MKSLHHKLSHVINFPFSRVNCVKPDCSSGSGGGERRRKEEEEEGGGGRMMRKRKDEEEEEEEEEEEGRVQVESDGNKSEVITATFYCY